MKILKPLSILAIALASLEGVSFGAGNVGGVTVGNHTDKAIWVTFYGETNRRNNMARGCVLPNEVKIFPFGKFVKTYYTLGEVKASSTSCSENSNFRVIEANRINDASSGDFYSIGTGSYLWRQH